MTAPRSLVRSGATVLAVAVLAMMPARGSSASMIDIVPLGPTFLLPGGSETISVRFTSSFLIQCSQATAADIDIAYDSTRFMATNVQLGTLDRGNGFSIITGPTNAGHVVSSISATSAGNSVPAGGSGTLETFTLAVLAAAPPGGAFGDINLPTTSGNSRTDVFTDPNSGANLTLTPAPTNGFDPTLDGTEMVVNTAVPDPSFFILMGLGGGLVTLTTLLRKKARRSVVA
jgi:hypothetical protein